MAENENTAPIGNDAPPDSSEPTHIGEIPATPAVAKLKLTQPHPLIRRTMDLKPETDAYGYARQPAWPGVDMRVSKSMKRNALIVLDRLFKALEDREIKVEVHQGGYRYGSGGSIGTFAEKERDHVQLFITEEQKKVAHEPTPKELREKERAPYMTIPKWDTVYTGKLNLTPGGVVDLSSEESLGRLIAKATDDIERQLDEEHRRREAAEERQRQEHKRQQQEQEEKARVEALHKSAEAFHRYRILMDYIAEVRRFGKAPSNQRTQGQSLQDWLNWAEWQARNIHPLG